MANQIGQKSATTTAYLNPDLKSPAAQEFEDKLAGRIVGQERAVRRLTNIYQIFLAGLAHPGRPVGTLLFLGPTGSGKTRVVEAAAEVLFGDPNLVTKIDCAEFQHSHEIAKLIGSPPGYLGHRETSPMLTQENLDRSHTETIKLSLVLFDEIEKASDALWQLLLGILDKATLTLGDNRRVDFSHSIVIMTSNLGAREMSEMISGGIGFAPKPGVIDSEVDQKIYRTALDAARRKFSPEFMNRIDKVVVFRSLRDEHLRQILGIELNAVQDRITRGSGEKFVFRCTDAAKQFLLDEGIDFKYGARHLKRAIERFLVFPLSNLVATGQVGSGDLLIVDYSPEIGKLVFSKEPGALVVEGEGNFSESDQLPEEQSSGNAAMILPNAQPAPARAKEKQK
ncbi:MAG TPA: AAA family ATPase [Blastocatellia bacterium]|nr:AAA family ATPase [Blastocatellia bacterium]